MCRGRIRHASKQTMMESEEMTVEKEQALQPVSWSVNHGWARATPASRWHWVMGEACSPPVDSAGELAGRREPHPLLTARLAPDSMAAVSRRRGGGQGECGGFSKRSFSDVTFRRFGGRQWDPLNRRADGSGDNPADGESGQRATRARSMAL